MRSNIKKIKVIIIGFLILFIPFFFLCDELNKLYTSTKEDLNQNLKSKILLLAKKFKTDLDAYTYLCSEINKIHEKLFPNLKEEITDKILDDSYAESLYTQKTFDNLLSLSKEKFSPIYISMGTNNLTDNIPYFSKELERDINNVTIKELAKNIISKFSKEIKKGKIINIKEAVKDEKSKFINSKASYDAEFLYDLYKICFKTNKYENAHQYLKKNRTILSKYISRFKNYQYYTKTYYTDYFHKQIIYNVSKHTFSKKGIHGYYSLVIPQSQIDPNSIIDSAIKNNISSDVNIEFLPYELINSNEKSLSETEEGYCNFLELSTNFKHHIETFYRLNPDKSTNENKSKLLNKIFKLSIKYPKELKQLSNICCFFNYLTIIFILLYIYISINLYKNKYQLTFNLTRKLILVLTAVIILPIFGVGLLTWISSQKFTKIIDNNVSINLSNEINNIITIHNENNQRQLSEIFELKRKIEKNHLYPEMKGIFDGIISKEDTDTWYRTWTTHLVALTQDNSFYNFYPFGKSSKKSKIEKTFGVYLPIYANNLNILDEKKSDPKNDISTALTLGTLEKYITISQEEQSAGQESIPHTLLLHFNETHSGVYFYAQDYKKQHNLLFSALTWNDLRNQYIANLRLPNRQNWFETRNDYSEINLGIAISDHFYIERDTTYPFLGDSYKKVKDIINGSILSKDSLTENSQQADGKIVKKTEYTDNDAFVIGGAAKSNYNNIFSLRINMIFPFLLIYAIFLMFLLTGFISVFIKEPVEIYKEAINSLENKDYGVTIDSFSKDEFDSITTAFNEMSLAVKQKFLISRYVSDKLIQSVNQDKVQDAGDGKQEKVTILSSDIRNFTGTSELYEPSVIVDMLNSYFTIMQQVISENGGIIDKYIGDAIQAVFYDEPEKENQVVRASRAALAMRKALEKFNKKRDEAGLFTIQNGISIDTDFAITGTIGTEKGRKDFSVNGDVIAKAAELEAKTKQTQSKILISKRSIKELDCHASDCFQQSAPSVGFADSSPINVGASLARNDSLIYSDFDSESAELIDVR